MRIGIFGGTFNPIHNGHIQMAIDFIKVMKLDKLLIIPTSIPPHKNAKNLASGFDRLNMCNLAISQIKTPNCTIEVSDIEIKYNEKSYTVDTLTRLKEIYPNDCLFLLMGADMFLTFSSWKSPQEILKKATLCAMKRDDVKMSTLEQYKKELESLGGIIELVNILPPIVSSTLVREAINKGQDVSNLISQNVCDYINQNKIY